jgi:hypothetical protein
MKKRIVQLTGLFSAFILLSAGTTFAQIKQGTVLAGGRFDLSFGTNKSETPTNNPNVTTVVTTRYSEVTFSPKVGLFVTDALALGVDFAINSRVNKNKDNGVRSTSSSFTLGGFGRYYFPSNIFLEGALGFGSQSTNSNPKANIFTYSLGAGYPIFFNKNVALEPMILYKGVTNTRASDDRYKIKDTKLQVGVGLQVYF